jgi:class 3 adenylate cyclase
MPACPSCGSDNSETAKFCSECGAQLAARPAAQREERKVVSVVFVDLVGSTARAETSDPEDVRALLRVYHERAREQLESFGGTVEKFIGDAVVAVFGAPTSHEDDPERAVRAALAVREAVSGLNEAEPGRDLHVRIAVNTGEALVSLDASPGEGEGMVAGDVVNTAARLQSAAPVDGILVGEQAHRATERAIVYREHEAVVAKGKADPIPVWEALEPRSRLGIDLGGQGRAELVGRDEELSILVGALGRARRESSTQFVTLVGVPGIGKSRLLYELGRVVDEDEELITWRQGRSLPYGEGVSFWALGEIVKAQAGIYESDDADDAASKLRLAAGVVVVDEGEAAWVERHLQPLVGLGEDAAGERRGETFAAWRRFLEGVAEEGPTVLVFEDLHWADEGLLDFVDGLVDWVDGVALLVVCTARPELLDRRPGWGGGKRNSTTVSLSPLAPTDTARLVAALLERPLLDAEMQQALVERSSGNPLYAEEFVRMLEAGGVVQGGLPETVHGIVAARIDLLPVDEKDLLQRAAVLGKVFWSDALGPLAGSESWKLAELLRSLERKEFVRREHRSAVAGATQHSFVHALVRDAAYAQLPRHVRADLHVAAATWIESLPADRSEDRAETLAHHYLTAIELLRAAGQESVELGARALKALQEAGERALALSSYVTAERFLVQALELVPAGEKSSAELLFTAGKAFGYVGREGDELARAVDAFERAGAYERAAEAAIEVSRHGWYGGGASEARAWLDRAAALVEGRPPSRAKAYVLAERARQAMLDYRYETAIPLADMAVAIAQEIADDEIRADALVTRGVCQVSLGDRDGIRVQEEALALVGTRGRVAGRGLNNLAASWGIFGELRESARVSKRALEIMKIEGDEQGSWFQRGNQIGGCYSLGDWDEALALVELLLAAPERFRYMEHGARMALASVLDARGQVDAAVTEARAAVRHARGVEDAQALWPALVSYARLARRRGLANEGAAALDEVVAALQSSESVGDVQEWHVELVLALAEADRGDVASTIVGRMPDFPWRDICQAVVAGEYVTAADLLEGTGEQPLQAELRLTAARELATAGRLPEAEAQLERARVFWRSVGATAYLRVADEILAAAS